MMSQASKIRVGAVSYLNTRPLVYELAKHAPECEVSFDLPSRLADDLASGQLDVALIPSIEFFQNPEYAIVSDACIACRGPVMSVKLYSRVPMDRIRSLALDEGSRTSVALSRILLAERYGVKPELVGLPIGAKAESTTTDAVLLIGDRAMHAPNCEFAAVWDLGDEWCRWSELPFVFAMWVARPGVNLDGIDSALRAARDAGVLHLEDLAATEAATVGLSPTTCLSYFRDNLHFFLGSRERRGLQLFLEHAQRMGLARNDLELNWNDWEPTRQSC